MSATPDPAQSECTISRLDLMEVVGRALANTTCANSTRERIFRVAETTDAVAVGWFHCGGVQCPASQARRRNQEFQQAFDEMMASRFGVQIDTDDASGLPFEPFVVTVDG